MAQIKDQERGNQMSEEENIFQPGDYVVYEFRRPNNGFKYVCKIVAVENGWVIDEAAGTTFSASFRPEDVIIWEHRKGKKSKT